MFINKTKIKNAALDLAADVAGGALYSLGIYTFAAANTFTSGGVSGLAIVINYVFSFLPIGMLTLLLNIPLAIIAWRKLGIGMVLKTIKTVAIITVLTDLVFPLIPPYTGNTLLAALFCGASMGAGIALIFMRGSSTGGTDFLTLTLKQRWPHLNIGVIAFGLDTITLLVAAVVFRNVDSILYGAVSMFVGSRVIDTLLYGVDCGVVLMIVTDKADEISSAIDTRVERGSTHIPAYGSYSKAEKTVVMVAVRKNQMGPVKRIVREVDPAAFMTAIEAAEIMGEGFKPHI